MDINKLHLSIPKRINAVLTAKGGIFMIFKFLNVIKAKFILIINYIIIY